MSLRTHSAGRHPRIDFDQSESGAGNLVSAVPENLEEKTMTYLDPADTQTMKRIGINVVALIGVSLCLIAVVMAII